MTETRIETDSMGDVSVPADRYWGAQTQRSHDNFPIGTETFRRPLIWALGVIKRAAADTNAELGLLDKKLASAIADAAQEVVEGIHDDDFPLVVWQTGSGTQTNMNANEVIANRAIEMLGGVVGSKHPVHPNDHVNLGQSSNDVFPTAMHVATLGELNQRLLPALEKVIATLEGKKSAFEDVIKIGRTHLQDATPLTVGQEISGWIAQLAIAASAVRKTMPHLRELALGGTAVGTGLNTHPRFGSMATTRISELVGFELSSAPNKFASLAGHEPLVATSGALKTVATALMKVANDVRWLASGPRCGIGELEIPANEPGSSIMPGKVNPTQAEALTMVCCQVLGNDVTIGIAGASGSFQLNTFKPVILHNVLQSIRLLADAALSFEERCLRGLKVNTARVAEHLGRSLMLVTALSPVLGYDRAAQVAKRAHETGQSLRETVVELGFLSKSEFDERVRPELMLGPQDRD